MSKCSGIAPKMRRIQENFSLKSQSICGQNKSLGYLQERVSLFEPRLSTLVTQRTNLWERLSGGSA